MQHLLTFFVEQKIQQTLPLPALSNRPQANLFPTNPFVFLRSLPSLRVSTPLCGVSLQTHNHTPAPHLATSIKL